MINMRWMWVNPNMLGKLLKVLFVGHGTIRLITIEAPRSKRGECDRCCSSYNDFTADWSNTQI